MVKIVHTTQPGRQGLDPFLSEAVFRLASSDKESMLSRFAKKKLSLVPIFWFPKILIFGANTSASFILRAGTGTDVVLCWSENTLSVPLC